MKTFNGDKELKASLVKELKRHKELDAFVQGEWLSKNRSGGEDFKGCFYGCTMQTEENALEKFSEKYNIDLWFVHITEKLFEGLPDGEYQNFPLEAIEKLPVNFDVNKIKSDFHYALLMDKDNGQINFANGNEEAETVIKQCAELFKTDFNKIDKEAAAAVGAAAEAAAEAVWSAVAWSAAGADAEAEAAAGASASAAAAVEEEVEAAVEAAAEATEGLAVWSVAKSAHYVWMRGLLFTLITKKHE